MSDDDLMKQTLAAWKMWQSEESRDRGYDFALCSRLSAEYIRLNNICRERGLVTQ